MLERDRWQTRAGKLICAVSVIVGVYVILKYMLGALLPFILAWVIATPIASLSAKSQKKRGGDRRSWSVFYMIILWGTLGIFLIFFVGKIGREISAIIEYTVENKEAIGGQISGMINTVVEFPKKLPIINSLNIEGLEGKIDAFVGESLQNISKKGTELLASGVGRVALATPRFFVSLLVCFIASVYIAGDRENIIDYFFSLLNEKNRDKIKCFFSRVGRGIRGYAKAYLWLFFITFSELYVGFLILRVKYAFVLAIGIALFDLLPMFSSAVVLVPWGIIMIAAGNYGVGAVMIVLAIVIAIVRQIAEPRLVGKGLGIHPLASLAAIYIGFRLFGFFGMILAPVSVLVIREILQSTKKEEKIEEKT